MKSVEHAVIGTVVAAVTVRVVAAGRSRAVQAALWTYGLAASVLIDLDHFPIARAVTGDWRHLRRIVDDPAIVVVDQDRIFDADFRRARIASHLLIGTGLVAGLRRRAPATAAVTAACLAAHVVADVLRDEGVA